MSSSRLEPSRTSLRRRQHAALAPVRGTLLRDAQTEADRLVDDARRAARARVEQAEADAAAAITRAEAAGRAEAAPLAMAELSRGRREAREILLAAQSRARAELEGQIRAAIIGLRHEARYGGLRTRLSALAQQAAGPGATVTEHRDGGVVARGVGVLVDCSLPRLADRAVEQLGPRIHELTAP